MNISLSILESNQYIRQKILETLSIEINKIIDKSIPIIKNNIVNIIDKSLKEEPEYQSLKSGKLRYEFGIPDDSAIDSIVSKLANTVDINKTPIRITNMGLSGGLNITAIESETFNGLLTDSNAVVQDNTRGYTLPWLEWLLLKGNEIIVRKYDVKYGPNPASRTGNAIMVESNRSWRVPPEFAGNSNNNWTTRAIERSERDILKIIQQTIESNI